MIESPMATHVIFGLEKDVKKQKMRMINESFFKVILNSVWKDRLLTYGNDYCITTASSFGVGLGNKPGYFRGDIKNDNY